MFVMVIAFLPRASFVNVAPATSGEGGGYTDAHRVDLRHPDYHRHRHGNLAYCYSKNIVILKLCVCVCPCFSVFLRLCVCVCVYFQL